MFLKILVSVFSFIVLAKNISYSMYEYNTNKNIFGAFSIGLLSFFSVVLLNIVLFFINY